MFKISVALILILSFAVVASAEEGFDVRKVKWGMSVDDVVKSELPKEHKKAPNDAIIFVDNLFSQPCSIVYNFKNNRLVSVVYFFKPEENITKLLTNIDDALGAKYKPDDDPRKMSQEEKYDYNVRQKMLRDTFGYSVTTYSNSKTKVLFSNRYKKDGSIMVLYESRDLLYPHEQEEKEANKRDSAQF